MGLLNTFSGGALKNFSIFAISIYPYITASIIVQLLSMDVVPKLPNGLSKGTREKAAGANYALRHSSARFDSSVCHIYRV